MKRTLLKKLYLGLFPDYLIELKKAVGKCKSLLDVGCGSDSPIKFFSKKLYCVGVDAFSPSIKKSKDSGIHNKYFKMNVLDIGKKIDDGSFECVVASDLIEHLTKKEGLELIKMMEKIASRKIIIFTPNGFLFQEKKHKNPWQVHKSGWSVKEMKSLGYKVIGIGGWKKLRKEEAKLRYKPEFFWKIISDITQLFVKNNPSKAFQILCVKIK